MTTAVAASSIENAAEPHLPASRILGYAAGDAGCNIAFHMTGLFLLVFIPMLWASTPFTPATYFFSSRSGTRSPICSPVAWSTGR